MPLYVLLYVPLGKLAPEKENPLTGAYRNCLSIRISFSKNRRMSLI